MDDFRKRFYRFNWGRKPDGSTRGEAEQRELNEGLAVSLAVLCWVSLFGLFTLIVLQRFGVQWAEESWLAQGVFALIIMSPLLSRDVRRISFAPRKLRAEEYERYMALQKKKILCSSLVGALFFTVFMPGSWQQGWGNVAAKFLIALLIFALLMYAHVRIEARRALARHEEELAEGGE